ncbi:MAG: hypothetical protein QOI64_1812 [Solirubrobacteraceae bacterium]|jgi:hypothetical protein|nr:hypothetical protein [Solirubrobacteraceae bacterium]
MPRPSKHGYRARGRSRRAAASCDPGEIAPRRPTTALPALLVLCALLLAACGAENRGQAGTVALHDSRAGESAAVRVIRLWSDALRRSDVERASSLWAIPSKVQNGTPVLTLETAATVRLFNDSLSCGSKLVSARAHHGFTIAVFRLTQRPGAQCGSGTGHVARTAIRVRDGKIAEWYRLPDDPGAPDPAQPVEPHEPAGPIV